MAKLTDAVRVTAPRSRQGLRTSHLKEVRSIRPAVNAGAADSLNALLHHRIRLGIVSALAGIDVGQLQ